MCISKKQYILLFLAATLAGIALHSLYHRLPFWPVALFAPVRESLWEHLKLLFWPGLLSSLWLARRGCPLRPRLLTLLVLCTAQLSISFWYHILLGGESVAVDIGLYLLMMAAAFVLPLFQTGPFTGRLRESVLPLFALLLGLILLFTFFPPNNVLFLDLSGAHTWSQIPF